jgi:uncharacterized protein YlxW (UPF0749 family)
VAKAGVHARQRWPLAVLGIFALTGFLFVTASVSSDGNDLRPAGGDVGSLLQERAQRVDGRRDEARDLRADIDELSARAKGPGIGKLRNQIDDLERPSGLTALTGPGIRVSLTDAPKTVDAPDVDPRFLVVHQQDIQAYVNALWAGGAEAVTLQGQRLIATTGIKCVGNTVVLDGIPYSPPYVIEAIGDQAGMQTSLATSFETVTYAEYAEKYQLGLDIETVGALKAEAYAGAVSLRYARATS